MKKTAKKILQIYLLISLTSTEKVNIFNNSHNRCIKIQKAGNNPEKVLKMTICKDNPDQKWEIKYLQNKKLKLKNPSQNKCITLEKKNNRNEGPISIKNCEKNQSNQEWLNNKSRKWWWSQNSKFTFQKVS